MRKKLTGNTFDSKAGSLIQTQTVTSNQDQTTDMIPRNYLNNVI